MNQTPPYEPQRYPQNDEISLVDLAKILIKRWKTMVLIFLIVVLGALAYVLLTERSYEYVSIYQVAEEAPGRALETPASVLAKVNNLYVGPETRKLRESAGLESLPFEVTVANPNDTLLIRLGSEASEDNHELVAQMHEGLLARMTEGQGERLERRQASLEQQLKNTEAALESVEQTNTEWGSELIASYTERLAGIQLRLTQLSEGQVVQVAMQSLEPTGTSRSLIMALALVLGGMLGVIAAFFSQFAVVVRDSLSEEAW
ncbi:lipopolysaccharide biosynthesis protein [Halomonas sp. ZH2S]|uniref:Lipopolysaccharide biosynthesis protein n=1 Tax=Vreelandella zhuhanensis TaxID=2684210 RepID=A0A7X3KR48_9GAMM|nr:Wzz/FepE/Etk N-terminal domain-containing protein [Halomonas zhuhanensis]MWJ27627.1 lipopolysaccharide biosynthesis protein [Halomonas zhuhanensis]